jgi:hypothetical protein
MKFLHVRAICLLMVYALVLIGSATARQTSGAVRSSAPLTNQDIILMTRSKFDDATIVKTIQAFDTTFDLSVTALVTLKDAGVTQTVMEAMIATSSDRHEERPAEAFKANSADTRHRRSPQMHGNIQRDNFNPEIIIGLKARGTPCSNSPCRVAAQRTWRRCSFQV